MRKTGALGAITLALLAACGSPPPATPDASADAPSTERCATDADCDDGLFCTGAEVCDPADPGAAADGCAPASSPCAATETCDEAGDRCSTSCADADRDGARDAACGGTDCDDADPARAPGLTEICDGVDRDEDCDPVTFGFRDADSDGYPDASCCNGTTCGDDCNDFAPGVHPGLPETCDLRDNDCDGAVDDGVLMTFWVDADGDLHGDPSAATMTGCFLPTGYALVGDDCDDTRMDRHPGLPERCDRPMAPATAVDEDCDGTTNEDCDCADGETRPCMLPGECMAGVETCVSGMYSATCSVAPVTEVCNGLDDDCDGVADELLTVPCFADGDDDTYPAPGASRMDQCPAPGRAAVGGCPSGFTNREPTTGMVDCNDADGAAYPGAPERCNGLDDDCNGYASGEDDDGDLHAAIDAACVADVYLRDDCNDYSRDAHPGQTAYFAQGHCANGYTPCEYMLGMFACQVGFSCVPENGTPSFDYDCDGALTRPTPAFCSGALPMCYGGCTEQAGPTFDQVTPPACGTPVTHVDCACDAGTMRCAGGPSGTEPLPCR